MKTIKVTEKIKTALIDFDTDTVEVLYAYLDVEGNEFAQKRTQMNIEDFATADKKKARDMRGAIETIIKSRM